MYDHYPLGEILVISDSPDNFQQKMNNLFHGFEFIHAYKDYLLISTKVYWKYHVHNLELTLNKLKLKGLSCNIKNTLFGYLGFWVTHDGIKITNKNIEAIQNMIPPNSRKRSKPSHWCGELLPRYVVKTFTYISTFK